MSIKQLRVAVDCCTRSSGNWESTCGKCPFRNPRENGDTTFDASCIDKLILALAEYLPKEDED